ncbi:MAG: uridine kinase [Candidatus Eiseniibacteriota bacterium]
MNAEIAPIMRPVVIGIAGGSGSGKTTVALRLADRFAGKSVVIVHHDSYYRNRPDLSLEERARLNYDHPDAFENDLLARHLVELRAGRAVPVPVYDYETHTRRDAERPTGPASLILVEGIQVLTVEELRALMDIKLFVDAEADERLMRRLLRDIHERGRSVHSVLQQYQDTVRPMHQQFVEPSKRHADFIIPRGGFNDVAIDLIVSKMREVLDRAEAAVEER